MSRTATRPAPITQRDVDAAFQEGLSEGYRHGVRQVVPARPETPLKAEMPRRFDVRMLLGIPGLGPAFAGEFHKVVPDRFLTRDGDGYLVACTCGTEAVQTAYRHVSECPGECGRYFLQTESTVRVARWEA
jgi:hypothetical protein